MKLLHTADLHLDSVLEANLDAGLAADRRRELLLTFGRMVTYAADNGVSVFLIAGDLFDTPHPAPDAEHYVLSVIADHPEIDFLVLGGNHGGAYAPYDPPRNYHTFSDRDYTVYRYGNVTIAGSENNAAFGLLPVLDPADINIVMLHGALTDSTSDLTGINPKFYRGRNIDYLALGHYHSYRKDALDARGVLCYCGTPEGRGFDEVGEKGFVLIDTAGDKLSSVFIPFAKRQIRQVTVDISRLFNQRDIEKAVTAALVGIPASDMVRVTLRGYAEPEMHKDPRQIAAMLDGKYFFSEVLDESNLSLRPEAYRTDISLRGEFVRTVMQSGLPRQDMERIIQCGLRALGGEELPE